MKELLNPKKVKDVAEEKVVSRLAHGRDSAFHRFPLVFTLLGAFGVVATFYGFEGLINKVDWLARNPFSILAAGVITLLITGTLYKKL